jgi:aryl-alcohol dehydrogenase-like predicted oxidoreductase
MLLDDEKGMSVRYTLLGPTGLRVSEFALGTMTFGERMSWGSSAAASERILETFAEAGGNFIDTADRYAEGNAESILGKLLAGRRDQFVLATKYTLQTLPGDLNSAGNHRKNLVRSVEASLRRLNTDYIDLLWVHTRETWTPVAEVMRALDDQVRAGKVLYVGVSDWPAWEVAQGNTLAELRGWSPFIGMQLRYNLLERTPERELLPMASVFDLGTVVWGPLAEGRLTGKYLDTGSGGRLETAENIAQDIFEHSRTGSDDIVRLVVRIAADIGCSPAQVALAWLRSRPGAIVPILGATRDEQLRDNLASADVTLDARQRELLDEASAVSLGFPHDMLRQRGVTDLTYGDQWNLVDDRRTATRRQVNDQVPS